MTRRGPSGRVAMAAALASGVSLFSCGGPQDPSQIVVARLDGRALHRSDLDTYVASALARSGGEPRSEDERDRVLSRLLDDYLDEEILLQEANRRGVSVTDQEVEAYLTYEGPPDTSVSGDAQRAMARRHLAIRKLQEAFVRAGRAVSDRDIEAYLAERGALPRRHVVLRTLKFASAEEAERTRRDLLTGKSRFGERAEARDPELGAPLKVALDALPPEVRGAVEGLAPGRPSAPVALHGAVYLFEIEPGATETAVDPAEARRVARDELQRARGEQASRALLEALRKESRIEIRHEALPFRYVAETETE